MTTSFSQHVGGYSGPGQGIIDRAGTAAVLPVTDGDATVSVTEENFNVTFDQTGSTIRQVFRLGQNIEILYPTKTASFVHVAAMLRGDKTIGTTADPDASAALVARETINAPTLTVSAKTAYTFDMWRTAQPLFNTTTPYAAVTRTIDDDKWGCRVDDAVFSPNGEVYRCRNGEAGMTLKVTGILPAITDTLYRFFNTDLALAS